MIKMETRSATISFAKGKAQTNKKRETEITGRLETLDKQICNSRSLGNLDSVLTNMKN